MEEKIEISILLGMYGNLLTDKQKEFMEDYYNNDLSLSEIADNNGITRQAVRTILVKSKKRLKEYEEKLRFMQKQKKIKQILKNTKYSKEDIKKKIEENIDF